MYAAYDRLRTVTAGGKNLREQSFADLELRIIGDVVKNPADPRERLFGLIGGSLSLLPLHLGFVLQEDLQEPRVAGVCEDEGRVLLILAEVQLRSWLMR